MLNKFKHEKSVQLVAGIYKVSLLTAEEKMSSKGKEMLAFEFLINGTKVTIKHNIVDSEFFNSYLSRVIDCFKLDESDMNIAEWSGKKGVVKLSENEEGYLNITKFYKPEHTENLKILN